MMTMPSASAAPFGGSLTGWPSKDDFARGRLLEAGHHLDERRFSGAVFTHQRMDFAGAKIEVDAEQDLHAVEGLAYAPGGQHHRRRLGSLRTHDILPADSHPL
jgi:hypothetical protein